MRCELYSSWCDSMYLKVAVKATLSMWMRCDCVIACLQPDWSGNIVACHDAAAVDGGKTCWFRIETGGKRRERKWLMGKIKSNFLFLQQPPEKQGGHTNPWLSHLFGARQISGAKQGTRITVPPWHETFNLDIMKNENLIWPQIHSIDM